jgi:uncharacterized protein YndB with AHSA1/START domain/effector-binding domain-containing protein
MLNTGTLKVGLPSDREIRFTRVFAAPRALVYDCLTRPELVRRWFGPHGYGLSVCDIDLREGGTFRYVIDKPDGGKVGMRGTYHQLNEPDGLVHSESFDDFPGEALATTVLTEENGKTTLTVTVLAPSQAARDGMLKTGMEHGAAESYDRMAELLDEQVKALPPRLDPPRILDLPAFRVARIPIVTPAGQIMVAMNEGLRELKGTLAAQGIEPTGPWFTHHLKVPDGTFDFEICLPVAVEVKPEGRVEMGEIRAARTARTTYRGDYGGLGDAWGRFMGWIEAQGVTPAPDLWEVYAVGPEASPNPGDWQTQLNRPLISADH